MVKEVAARSLHCHDHRQLTGAEAEELHRAVGMPAPLKQIRRKSAAGLDALLNRGMQLHPRTLHVLRAIEVDRRRIGFSNSLR